MIKVQILKRMQAGEVTLQSGDIVDATGWRHIKSLESNRYIKVLSTSVNEVIEKKPKEVEQTPVAEEVKPKPKTVTKE